LKLVLYKVRKYAQVAGLFSVTLHLVKNNPAGYNITNLKNF